MRADDRPGSPADRPGPPADRPPPATNLDEWPTGRLLSAAARLVEHAWNAHLARWDLNHAGLAALHVLLGGPLAQRELANRVQVEDQTLSRTVERLERSGYVERRRDPVDRRRIVVTLTAQGRGTCLRAGDPTVAEGFFAALGEDLQPLRRALTEIVRHHSGLRWPDGQQEYPAPDHHHQQAAPGQAAPGEAAAGPVRRVDR
jgi:DNA-binding MarR family transcriptional regulator